MKLWQKIFLSSLLLIIAAVNIVSLTLLRNSHRLLIEREQSHAVNEHEYFSAAFINAVTYEKLEKNSLALNINEISKVAKTVVNSSGHSLNSAIYYSSQSAVALNIPNNLNKLLYKSFLNTIDISGNEYSIIILDSEGSKIMAVGSALKVEGETFFIVTASDISEIYILRDIQSDYVRKISIASSVAISLILLVMTIALLRPLKRLNIYTKAIAGGQYGIRIRRKGSREFCELADNMNVMAEAVQIHALHLEKIAESRQTFIANLAHEMKTPLTSILGFGDLLRIKKNVSDSERVEYAAVIVEETKRLRSLSGKLMELVALGGTEIEKKPLGLKKLINDIRTALTPLLIKNKITLVTDSDDIIVNADEELFKSLICNIIENAVKASPKDSEIKLTAKMKNDKAVIAVADKGIGMTAEEAEHVFEPFYMADKSRSRKAGGAGLGLALCAEIAKLHSSKLKIDSKPNVGTTVYIEISEVNCK